MTTSKTGTSRRLVIILAAAVAVVALGGYGYQWWNHGRFIESTDDAYVGGDLTVIGSKVAGYIANVAVTDNQAVHAGDILVRLDDRDYRAALAQAQGAVDAQQALIAHLDATRSLQDAVILQARAGIAASDAQTTQTHADQVRYQALSANASVSVQSFQKADADYKQSLANAQKSQAELIAAQRQLTVIDTQKQQARAALEEAIAARDIANLNLSYTVVRAPVDGTIGNRRARLGAYASAGTQLMVVVPSSGLWVDANFKEGQLADMHPGQAATIEADVLPGHVLHGKVASLAPATGALFSVLPTENATGNFTKIVQRVPVRIVLDQADAQLGLLRPGLSVIAQVDQRGETRRQQ